MAAKTPRADPVLAQLSARIAGTPADALAAVLVRACGSAAAALAALPAQQTSGKAAAVAAAARAVEKAAHCRYSSRNAFSLGRARGAIAALVRLVRAQGAELTKSKDAAAIAAWATETIAAADNFHAFDEGLTAYADTCKGAAGKAAAAALRGAWGKGASAADKAALAAAAEEAPKKKAVAGAGAGAGASGAADADDGDDDCDDE